MPGFETIAKPHSDIERGNFTLDTYAARLGDVVKNEGAYEYKNANRFFEKTYVTEGLKRLLSGVERRLKGNGGAPIVRLETPFGGGKTHTLIALYHKAKEWNAKPLVVVGSDMDATETFWGKLELELTGKFERFKGRVAPGRESILELLKESNAPVLLLMDEMLNYLTRAAGIRVGKGTLAEQTMAFMLALTEAVASYGNAAFIVTLQSSEIAPLEEKFPLFTKLLDRMKHVITPVEDSEIGNIIRQRLFSNIDEKGAKGVVREFVDKAKKENLLPEGEQASEYRKKFAASYPFQPEVIEVLYQRWGSFPSFQRTRGVLRLLSLVVSRAVRKNRPYISLADFELANMDIRNELLEHVDKHYESVLSNDIITRNKGAKTVDRKLAGGNQRQELGTRTATAIFLYSFTGGSHHRGTSANDIKRSAMPLDDTPSLIDTAINSLSENCFYLNTQNNNYYFDTQPNLGRIVQIEKANLEEEDVTLRADALLQKHFKQAPDERLKTYIAPKDVKNIPDTEGFKLVVSPKRDDASFQKILKNHGTTNRVHRNTIFFLTPRPGGATALRDKVKEVLAYEAIQKNRSLNLSPEQKRDIASKLKAARDDGLDKALRGAYRTILVPEKDYAFSEMELGLAPVGIGTSLATDVRETLTSAGRIIKSLGAQNIVAGYLGKPETVSSHQLLTTSLRTPGAERRASRDVWEKGITAGVEGGFFALGVQAGGKLIPRHFNTAPGKVTLETPEVLIRKELILESITPEDINAKFLREHATISTSAPFDYTPPSDDEPNPLNAPRPLLDAWKDAIREGVKNGVFGIGEKEDDRLTPRAFSAEPGEISLSDTEVLIRASLCPPPELPDPPELPETLTGTSGTREKAPEGIEAYPPGIEPEAERGTENGTSGTDSGAAITSTPARQSIHVTFPVPNGKVSDVATQMSSLQGSFEEIQITLTAKNGEISEEGYEDMKSALVNAGIEVKEV